MKKLFFFLSLLWLGLAQASAQVYDVDKTDAVDVSQAAWGGTNTYNYDVTTTDGRTTKMVEHYYGQLNLNEELPLKQTINGLPNGNYTVTLYAKTNCADWDFDVPADFVDGSYDYASVFACPGTSYSPAKAQTTAIEADVDKGYARSLKEYSIDVTVTDGSLTLGLVLNDRNKTNWHTIQIKSLIFHSDVPVVMPVNVTDATGLSESNATVWKRDNNGGNWQHIPNSGTDNWEQWQSAPGTLNNRIMYRTIQLPAGTYAVKASINALQQSGDAATDKNIDFYVQSGSDVQKVNCYGDFAARELEITLSDAAEVEIGIRAYAPATANWIALKNLRLTTTSYSTIEEFEAAYAPLKLAGAYSDLEYAYNNALAKLDAEGKAYFIEEASQIKSAIDNKTYTTEAQINNAMGQIQTMLVAAAYHVDGVDVTDLISNAVVANGNGWETPRTNHGQQYVGAPDDTYLDFWNNSGNITKTSQKITLPSGKYALYAATRSSNGEDGKIYAIVGETEFSAPIFKDGAEGGQLGGGWSVTKVKDIIVPVEQEVEIGFYCTTPDGNWAGADDFRLVRTGDYVVPVESVSLVDVTGETLDNGYITIEKGQFAYLVAQVYPSNATNKNTSWSVIQEDEVITCEEGIVTGLKAGKAAVVVTTEDGQKQAFVYVFVTEPEPEPEPQPTREPMTFEIQTGETSFTVTPSSQEYQYYIEVVDGTYTAEEITGYFDQIFEEMGAGLDHFTGTQTQSYKEDWWIDEPGDYTIAVCDVNDDYTRNGNVVLAHFTIPEPQPQGYTATLYNGDSTPITLENFDPTVKPAEATAANALIYVAADLSDVEGIIPNVVYEEGANSINIRNRAKELNLTDAQPFYIPEFFFADKVTYTRTFNNTEWQSMVLPFTYKGADFEGKAEVATFTGATLYDAEPDGIYDMAYLLYQSEMDKNNLLVYEPVLIKAKEVGEMTITWEKKDNFNLIDVFSSDDVFNSPTSFKDQSGTKYTLSTTFQPMAMYQTGYYGLSNGEFKYALSENAVLPPFRAYLEIAPGDGPQVPVCGLLVNDDPTAIKQINASKADNNYYDLSGRKVSNPTSGIYVKNGKKVLVK